MIYEENKHNFDLFQKNWNPENWYAIYGASKDCVQLIESFDFLLKKHQFNLKYIIDDNKESLGVYNNIYDLNSASLKPENYKNKPIRNNLKVISFNEYMMDKDQKKIKIIIASDFNYNKIKKLLLSKNFIEDQDFCKYKKIAAIWPFKLENKTHLWRTDILMTEKCTLDCTFCNMYMPHYKNAKHRDLNKIKSDISIYFKKIDYVSVLHMVGGETLMYPHFREALDYIGKNFRNKIGHLLISTNGTLVPKEETLNLIKKYSGLVYVSDYTDGINYKRKLNQVIESIKKYKINHLIRKDISWTDFGDPNVEKFHSVEEQIAHFDSCTAPFRGLNNSKYYYCHLNTSAVLAGITPENENDYISLNEGTKSEEILKFDLGFSKLGYVTFCKNCNGCNTGINIPVSFESQGLRK